MQYDFQPLVQGNNRADPYALQTLLQQAGLWDGFTNMPQNMGDRPRGQQWETDWARLNGYQLGNFAGDGQEYYALRDPQGNIVATDQYANGATTLRDLITGMAFVGGASYAIPALAGAAGYGGAAAATGAGGAASGGGAAASGGNALLGGATGGGTVAGSGLTAGANALYAPTGFAGGTGSALAGTSLGGAGTAAGAAGAAGGAAALGGGAGSGAGAMSGSFLGMSPNTWANLGSTALGLYGQNQALNAQQAGINQANEFNRYAFDTIRADNAPLVNMRNSVLPQIQNLLSNPGSITNQPDYQFQLAEGMKARQNSAAGQGMTYSGAQQKALTRYGQDYAGTKLDQSLNRLTNIAGLGQVGNNQTNQAVSNFANNAGNNALNMGSARGSAYGNMAGMANNALLNIFDQNQYRNINGGPG